MHILPFQATYPNLDLIPSPDSFFASVKNEYSHYRAAGFFSKHSSESIYVQEITTQYGTHRGLIARNDMDDFSKGKILKHENTLDATEQSMMNFLLQTKAMVKPVLLAYDSVPIVDDIIAQTISTKQPIQIITFASDETHKYWEISDGKVIAQLQSAFADLVPKCYIADGHHRCATMLKLVESDFLKKEGVSISHILTAYYTFENLKIFDYNRVFDLMGTISTSKFMARLSKYCRIKPKNNAGKPKEKHFMTLYIGGEWFKLRWRNKILKAYANETLVLDATLVNTYIFDKILQIADVRTNPRITYVEGVRPMKELIISLKGQKQKAAIFLHPITNSDLQLAANNNLSLPPKSTWFEPRIKSGLIVQEF